MARKQWESSLRLVTHPNNVHGGGVVTSKNLENHVRENIGWISFKTRNFYIFLDI